MLHVLFFALPGAVSCLVHTSEGTPLAPLLLSLSIFGQTFTAWGKAHSLSGGHQGQAEYRYWDNTDSGSEHCTRDGKEGDMRKAISPGKTLGNRNEKRMTRGKDPSCNPKSHGPYEYHILDQPVRPVRACRFKRLRRVLNAGVSFRQSSVSALQTDQVEIDRP